MILLTGTGVIEDTAEQVIYQVVPEAYQPLAMWLLGIALILWALRSAIKPFMDKWAANKQADTIEKNSLTSENVTEAVNKALAVKEKAEAQKDLITWEYKLLHATTQEAKDMCNLEIAKAQAIINA